MPSKYQCNGITTKGARCRMKCDTPDGYCKYHHTQQPKPKPKPKPKPNQPNNNTGYIYMYTMSNFLNPPKDWNFKVKNLPGASKRDQWVDFNSKKSPYILVKIGMTTQTPRTRIRQWQEKCHHDLTNVGPPNRHLIKKKEHGWLKLFMCLTIQDPEYARWRNEGFYCRNLKLVELTIHRELHGRYGKGDVYCVGCLQENARDRKGDNSSLFGSSYNVHVEWFLIPKRDIDLVYRLIDTTCVHLG
ncbi:hypothetical protein Cantr_07155 [Candida viswanathii]|uniref:Bacteriophage T5 Orf172 DNA-binding domain-containing protein n=1 Tax=Candida viswanathii TaxID=5486 RepID=A0A367XZE5_9ASCO|nr:hypothetical protein Cantr_07155 [Candida viswanathii]